jgi:hypothetical protein
MGILAFLRFKRKHTRAGRPARPAGALPRLEELESRLVPASVSGNAWPHPELVTLSFVPDGTVLGQNSAGPITSNLFSTFNPRFGSAQAWENIILKAAQTWAAQTNLNFALVPDNGGDLGSGPDEQGDPNMGDIRIGGYDLGNSNLAQAYMPPPANNYSVAGDIQFNTSQTFNTNGAAYDLFTVATHEIGHALGLGHSTVQGAVMYGSYNGTKRGLATDDISGIRAIYSNGNPRSPDRYHQGASSHGATFQAAAFQATNLQRSNDQGANFQGANDQGASSQLANSQAATFQVSNDLGSNDQASNDQASNDQGSNDQGANFQAAKVQGASFPLANFQAVNSQAASIGSFATAVDLTAQIDPVALTASVTGLDMTHATDQEYYTFTAPSGTAGTLQVAAQSQGLSLLAPKLTVYAADQQTVLASASGAGQYGTTLAVTVNGVAAGQQFYVKVTGADTSVFGTGAYALNLTFGNNPLPAAPSPVTTTAAGLVKVTGGGLAVRFTPDTLVNSYTAGPAATNALSPKAVAMDANGNYVVTWSAYGEDGDGWGVYARRFAADGTPRGREFRVNTTTRGDQEYSTVAMDPAGDFVITWSSLGGDWGVRARRYAADGRPRGREFRVNTTTEGDQMYSSAARDAAGDFVVTWSSNDVGRYQVFAQRYDSSGNARGGEFQVSGATRGDQMYSSAAMDAAGDFVITWSSDASGAGRIYAQRYDATGARQGNTFQVNSYPGPTRWSGVAMNSQGNFLITWCALGEMGSGWGVCGQEYDKTGGTIGLEFQANSTIDGDHLYPSAAMDANGHTAIVWSGNGPGDSAGVFAQHDVGADRDALKAEDTGPESAAAPTAPRLLPDGSAGMADQRSVGQPHRSLLGRQVDAMGLASWAGFRDAGASPDQVARGILAGAESRPGAGQALFQQGLHRAADPLGLASFGDLLQAGGTQEQAAALSAGSPEYLTDAGGNPEWHYLGRFLDDAARATWLGAVRQGGSDETVPSGPV